MNATPLCGLPPPIDRIDHVHLFVHDRATATAWYAHVLGLTPVAHLVHWAADGGPSVIADARGAVHLALFERPPLPCRSTIAFGVSAGDFARWRHHLTQALGIAPPFEDHVESWSLYFDDPDGNPFEITCDDVVSLRKAAG